MSKKCLMILLGSSNDLAFISPNRHVTHINIVTSDTIYPKLGFYRNNNDNYNSLFNDLLNTFSSLVVSTVVLNIYAKLISGSPTT